MAQCMAAVRDANGSSTAPRDVAHALAAVKRLSAVRVTAERLLETGAGREIKALSKSAANSEVAAAAAAVLAEWKADVGALPSKVGRLDCGL